VEGASTLDVEVLSNKSINKFFTKGQKMKAKSGFTLVEILIVVVILGILAAIVIPQFTEASSEAKLSSLCTDLQSVRSQIELYKIQHSDALPGAGGLTFIEALTEQSNILGATGADFGPYLLKIPVNPFATGTDPTTAIAFTITAAAGAPVPAGHWHFDTSDGTLHANDTQAHYDDY
jgi:general secretion pathway protein G